MTNYSKVPWLKVHEYLLKVGSCRTIREFTLTACRELEKIIPFDTTACLHRVTNGRSFDRCLGSACTGDATSEYNIYYRMRQPGAPGASGQHSDLTLRSLMSTAIIDWRKLQQLEYAADFMLPNGMCKSLACVFPTSRVALSAHRSRSSPDFTDTDITVLDLLNQHLNTYWPLLLDREGRGAAGEGRGAHPAREEALRLGLTRREAEITLLLSERLSMREIADRLFISPRTVEKHAENIYGKLGICRKQDIREQLRPLEERPYPFMRPYRGRS